MKARGWTLGVVGVLLILIGAVWALQGFGVLPGSFMTGSNLWLAIGLLCVLAGIVLLVSGIRGKSRSAPTKSQ